jgi:predicted phosphoribosyltransferase
MRAAVAAVKAQNPSRIVVGVPTAAPSTCRSIENEVDDIICSITPQPFKGVGAWYDNFSQTTDDDVGNLLEKAQETLPVEQ